MSAMKPDQTRRVVLVDAQDNALGVDGVLESHRLPGRKHRAFTAVIVNAAGEVLLAQRAPSKMLWPGYWDATVASHPRPDGAYEREGERRLNEEIGVSCALSACGRFDYDLTFLDVGIESEVCATLIGRLEPGAQLQLDAREVSATKWVALPQLLHQLGSTPETFCPWLFLAFVCIARNAQRLPTHLRSTFAELAGSEVESALRSAMAVHFPDGGWRLLDD
jgi:isopentenyl-diphosphate delta-isomerase